MLSTVTLWAGNFHQIFQDGREYNLAMIRKYGGAFKIHGILGVRIILLRWMSFQSKIDVAGTTLCL